MVWYNNYKEYLIEATSLLNGINELEEDETYEFYTDLNKEYFTKFIFESNNIEREGLAEGETKKLVFDMFNENDSERIKEIQDLLFKIKFDIIPKKDFNPGDIHLKDIKLAVKHKGKMKDINLVMNSFKALITARQYINQYFSNLRHYYIRSR